MDREIESTLSKSAISKQCGMVDKLEERDATQRDLDGPDRIILILLLKVGENNFPDNFSIDKIECGSFNGNTFSSMYDGIECTLSKFADSTKLCGAAGTLKRRDAIQRDLDRLERRVYVNLMKFNKDNVKMCTWIEAIPNTNTCWVENGLRADLWRKTLGDLNEKLVMKMWMPYFWKRSRPGWMGL
ncbi:hypothetical protein WISP_55792 [Willisornis vidua]|uniref:Rna-directed dna polymerase from mobile element jockey-like n=1 Tax=Willisornis vidua TaxID=1566151 RepID=A0ABQ9DGQ2_9PASS|nr:hypothetical protein WISP_55792 [Willisornis vidua]